MSNFEYNETRLTFGGFYESIHSNNIDNLIECYIEYYNEENNTNKEYDDFDFDYSKMHNQYIKQYCDLLEDYILNEYNLDIKFTDLQLISPSYYNYETDKIECKINKPSTLMDYFKTHYDFLEYLESATQSYSGYTSHYDYDGALNNKNNILMLYIFKYICNEFEKDNYFDDIYLDIELEKELEKA